MSMEYKDVIYRFCLCRCLRSVLCVRNTWVCVWKGSVNMCMYMCMSVCEKESECGPSRKEMERDELVYLFVCVCVCVSIYERVNIC